MSSNTASSSSGGVGSADASAPRRNSKRPKYSKFTQQELPACKPILTPRWVISAFLLVSIIFIPIGVASLFASRDVVEIVDQYETVCIPAANITDKVKYIQTGSPQDLICHRTITGAIATAIISSSAAVAVTVWDVESYCNISSSIIFLYMYSSSKVSKKMRQPIFVYYQLDNFYQNHRRYVKSRSDAQLKDNKSSDTSSCKPEETSSNGQPIVPCGLIAWSLFNDTYNFSRKNQPLVVNKKDISWKSDREKKFGKDVYPKNFQNGTLRGGASLNTSKPLSEQEDLIVWMRTAALPTFRKLYGRIEVDLEENDTIQVSLENNYNTYSFNGKKKLVLSTTGWLGGKNDFLGIAYLTVGGLSFFLALTFTVVYLVKPRRLGDPSYLSWNRNAGGH